MLVRFHNITRFWVLNEGYSTTSYYGGNNRVVSKNLNFLNTDEEDGGTNHTLTWTFHKLDPHSLSRYGTKYGCHPYFNQTFEETTDLSSIRSLLLVLRQEELLAVLHAMLVPILLSVFEINAINFFAKFMEFRKSPLLKMSNWSIKWKPVFKLFRYKFNPFNWFLTSIIRLSCKYLQW